MKIKKSELLLIAGTVLIIVALLGFLAVAFRGEDTPIEDGDTYSVVVRYEALDSQGIGTLFKTYTGEHSAGEQIIIKSPSKDGYTAEKSQISVVVNSDILMTVKYTCNHTMLSEVKWTSNANSHTSYRVCQHCNAVRSNNDTSAHTYGLKAVLSYPTPEAEGKYTQTCSVCNHTKSVKFTELTETITFGGEALRDFKNDTSNDNVINGYMIFNGSGITLLKEYATELDSIFNGVEVDATEGILGNGLTVTLDYDKDIWSDNGVVFKPHMSDPEPVHGYIRFGKGWRIIYNHSGGNFTSWISDDDCPLITAPITITVTYDFTADFN